MQPGSEIVLTLMHMRIQDQLVGQMTKDDFHGKRALTSFVGSCTALSEYMSLIAKKGQSKFMAEAETFPRALGFWQFQANGVEGKLSLADDGNGNLSGNINGSQQVLGFWDAAALKVTFLGIPDPANPTSVEVYTGYLSSHVVGIDMVAYNLVGSYQAFSGSNVNAQQNQFGWTASMSRPVV